MKRKTWFKLIFGAGMAYFIAYFIYGLLTSSEGILLGPVGFVPCAWAYLWLPALEVD